MTRFTSTNWRLIVPGIGLFLAFSGAASAAVIFVDDDGVECPGASLPPIATVVAAAAPGDTVTVCDGTYTLEPQITIDKSLTLNSLNGPAVTKIEGGGVYTVFIDGSTAPTGITIEGLDLSNPANTSATNTDSACIQVGGSIGTGATGITIRGNVLHEPRDPATPDCDDRVLGISMNFVEDVLIENNTIFDILNVCAPGSFTSRARGMFVKSRSEGLPIRILNNDIDGVAGPRAGGINLIGGGALTDFLVSGNAISGVVDNVGTFGSFGIELDSTSVGSITGSLASEITGNSIDGTSIAVRLAESVSSVQVTTNTYTGLIAGGFGSAFPLNGVLGPNGAAGNSGNDLCGNTDDPTGVYGADAGVVGNTFPGGAGFTGNFDCAVMGVPTTQTWGLVLLFAGLALALALTRLGFRLRTSS